MSKSDDISNDLPAHLDPMSPMREAFFTLHRDLPREGPGAPGDIYWAAEVLNVPKDARICEAACGPGADLPALLQIAPDGHVTALDKMAHFVEAAGARIDHDPRATLRQGDMAEITGPFDFIWCAGAVYMLGLPRALELWRAALAPGGGIAFSEPCYFTDTPSEAAQAFWDGHPVLSQAAIAAQITQAGYELIATRKVSDDGWEAYYTPQDARIASLRPGASAALLEVLDEGTREAALWRAARAETGYLLCAVRPKA